MTLSEKLLVWLLRLHGAAAVGAIFAVFMPAAMIAEGHEALGLGALELTPVVVYLARMVSVFYVILGALHIFASINMRDRMPLVGFLGWAVLAAGMATTGITVTAGLPMWWVMGEGVGTVAAGVAILILWKIVGRQRAPQEIAE